MTNVVNTARGGFFFFFLRKRTNENRSLITCVTRLACVAGEISKTLGFDARSAAIKYLRHKNPASYEGY